MTIFTKLAAELNIQGFTPPLNLRDFKLIAFDMDSTLINIECVDEIADAVGRKAEVAAITEAAMRGEITDFKDSLRRRVNLLKGVTLADLEAVYRDRLQLNPGATELVQACKTAGLKVLLVSGGFTFFADRVCERLGIDFSRANVLEMTPPAMEAPGVPGASLESQLTGQLVNQPWGDICDGLEKQRMLLQTCEELNITPEQAIAVGDGANDLPMMHTCSQAGGLSVAFYAKPKVREQAMVSIESGGLDRLLEVFRPSH
ncbi:MAG: phosphoserine phosphatase SerB [Betaproteobacteria bacterium]|nr:phosphoserine phosphatase SerB [Betaproteobacteria bacterium]